MQQNLEALLRTLNAIDVHGKENMYRLLGCILAVEKMLAPEEKPVTDPIDALQKEGADGVKENDTL